MSDARLLVHEPIMIHLPKPNANALMTVKGKACAVSTDGKHLYIKSQSGSDFYFRHQKLIIFIAFSKLSKSIFALDETGMLLQLQYETDTSFSNIVQIPLIKSNFISILEYPDYLYLIVDASR